MFDSFSEWGGGVHFSTSCNQFPRENAIRSIYISILILIFNKNKTKKNKNINVLRWSIGADLFFM